MKKTAVDIVYELATFGMPYEEWQERQKLRSRIAYFGDIVYPINIKGKKLKGWNKVVKEARLMTGVKGMKLASQNRYGYSQIEERNR